MGSGQPLSPGARSSPSRGAGPQTDSVPPQPSNVGIRATAVARIHHDGGWPGGLTCTSLSVFSFVLSVVLGRCLASKLNRLSKTLRRRLIQQKLQNSFDMQMISWNLTRQHYPGRGRAQPRGKVIET